MKFKTLVFSLLIISSSLNANTSAQIEEEVFMCEEYTVEEPVASEIPEGKNTIKDKLEAAVNKASMVVLLSVMGTLLDLKDFAQKQPTLVAGLTAIATYKLVRSRLQ